MSDAERGGHVGDRTRMDSRWPTHACPTEFWEELGRTIAAFGFLEDSLQRANLAITANREYGSIHEAEEAFKTWERGLELAVDETLGALARRFVTALKDDKRDSPEDEHEIEQKLKPVAWWRNALCHGAWIDYDTKSGYATLRYWPRTRCREQGDRPISRDDLARIRRAAVDVTILVIDALTTRGIAFPGTESPGRDVATELEGRSPASASKQDRRHPVGHDKGVAPGGLTIPRNRASPA